MNYDEWLDEQETIDFEDDEFYDENGRLSPSGIYDISGHIIPERYAEYNDYVDDYLSDR